MPPAEGPADEAIPPDAPTSPEPSGASRRTTRTFRNLRRPVRTEPSSPSPVVDETPAEPPPRRRRWFARKPRVTPPSQAELDALPVKDRQELHDAHRQRPWQMVTSLGVVLGVLFTAGGLFYTGRAWETSQDTLNATRETQITDRYTKAVEQLDSKTIEVRLGGLYGLNRIAADSPKDASTIQNVMAAFARNRDFCKQKIGKKPCTQRTPKDPAPLGTAELQGVAYLPVPTDVRVALELAASLRIAHVEGVKELEKGWGANLLGIHFREADLVGVVLVGANLEGANLEGANLDGANLTNADLEGAHLGGTFLGNANLTNADLYEANLTGAALYDSDLRRLDLRGANLTNADLRGSNLTNANLGGADLKGADLLSADLKDAHLGGVDLTGADLLGANLLGANLDSANLTGVALYDSDLRRLDLTNANLTNVDLSRADLSNANLTNANLTNADLRDANLSGALLTGADLRQVRHMTADQIRKVAITDATTKF